MGSQKGTHMSRRAFVVCSAVWDHLPWYRVLGALLLVAGIAVVLAPTVRSQGEVAPVYVVRVSNEIDLGLAQYVARILHDANRDGASAVVLEINTSGGRLDAAMQIRQALLDSPVRTIAFVNRNALSAGALLAIAADEVYMAPGAVMGAAAPVNGAGQGASAKTISAVRSTFGATAEARGLDPRLAEAMVDPSVAIDGLVGAGQILTLTATDARAWNYADGIVADRHELLQVAGLSEIAVQETSPALAEQTVQFITTPVVASVLIALGLLLIAAELFAGVGGAGVVGVGFLGVFFWGHMLAGLAGWEGVALVGIGLMLLAVEAFVIPGFGLAGIAGIVAFGAGLFVSLISGEIVTNADLLQAASTMAVALIVLIVGGIALAWLLLRTRLGGGLVLRARLGTEAAPPILSPRWAPGRSPDTARHSVDTQAAGRYPDQPSLTGSYGVAISDLRPGGIAEIRGARVDVVTQGSYLPAGTAVSIVRDDGYRRVVRRFEGSQGGATRPSSGTIAGGSFSKKANQEVDRFKER